jgi:hypothetical protein
MPPVEPAYRITMSIVFWEPGTNQAKAKINAISNVAGHDSSVLSAIEWVESGAPVAPAPESAEAESEPDE